ncbi:nuclear ubiquitous casein and cyclin-dependent kinase substrate 1a [Stigmatopora nigra]
MKNYELPPRWKPRHHFGNQEIVQNLELLSSEDSEEKLPKTKNDSADDFGSDDHDNDFGEEDEDGGSDYEETKVKKGKKPKIEKSGRRTPKRKRTTDCSDDDKDVSRKRTIRQAASKAVSKQREILLGDAGSEDEEPENQGETYLDPDESGSDEDFIVEDDDDSDYGHSKKRNKKLIRRGRIEKEKKSPKPRLKATVNPSPKGKGKGHTSTKALETSSPKEEEDEDPESPFEEEDGETEKKDVSPSPKVTKGDEEEEEGGSEEEAPFGED